MDVLTKLIFDFWNCGNRAPKADEKSRPITQGFSKTNTVIVSAVTFMCLFIFQGKAMSENLSNNQTRTEAIMTTPDQTAIKAILNDYFKALTHSSVSEAVRLYTEDGVFMPNGAPSSAGVPALKIAYGHVFKSLDFVEMGFTIDELTVSQDWAIIRTSSLGTLKILANNETIKDAEHREFFVMKKNEGQWKIARYMFNAATPPKH